MNRRSLFAAIAGLFSLPVLVLFKPKPQPERIVGMLKPKFFSGDDDSGLVTCDDGDRYWEHCGHRGHTVMYDIANDNDVGLAGRELTIVTTIDNGALDASGECLVDRLRKDERVSNISIHPRRQETAE